jgi:hypothetical protein
MTTVTLSWEDPDDAATFLILREEYRRHSWLPDSSMAELLELVRAGEVMAADPPPAARFISPDHPGQARVLLPCECGTVTDFTFELALAEFSMSCPCTGCGAVLPVPAPDGEGG